MFTRFDTSNQDKPCEGSEPSQGLRLPQPLDLLPQLLRFGLKISQFVARVLPHRPMVINAAGPFKSLMRFTSQINSLGKMRMMYNAVISRKTMLKALRHRKNVMIRISMITRSTQPMVNVKLVGTPD